MTSDQVQGLAIIGFSAVLILAGIAISIGGLGAAAGVAGVLFAVGGLARAR